MHNSESVLTSLYLFLIVWAIGGYLVLRGLEWLISYFLFYGVSKRDRL